jgi:hypothetical protein
MPSTRHVHVYEGIKINQEKNDCYIALYGIGILAMKLV